MLFGEKILDYWDDILKDLATVVAIPSVAKPQEGEHPFGDDCAKALDTVVALAESYGLKAKMWDTTLPTRNTVKATAMQWSWPIWTWSPPARAGTPILTPW